FGGFEGLGFEREVVGIVLGGDLGGLGFEVALDGADLGFDALDLRLGGGDVLMLLPGGGPLADGGGTAGDGAEAGPPALFPQHGPEDASQDGDAGLHLGGAGFS